ncbi:hypothetical protein B0J11DRAFT_576658 [Dendryphion nanum]|uniref:Uncharacterized protein n=1 Tax=Dendryphion nanum TaxID=256645 RepID=A0A9P9IXR5_9PLEO|nr:hypothetical protein B0J11DRAFT_576658 [Dendryphion nanum]
MSNDTHDPYDIVMEDADTIGNDTPQSQCSDGPIAATAFPPTFPPSLFLGPPSTDALPNLSMNFPPPPPFGPQHPPLPGHPTPFPLPPSGTPFQFLFPPPPIPPNMSPLFGIHPPPMIPLLSMHPPYMVPPFGIPPSSNSRPMHTEIKDMQTWQQYQLGPLIKVFRPEDIETSEEEISWSPETELLGSYNWQIDGKAINVPGYPREFNSQSFPKLIAADNDVCFIDEDTHRAPQYPFQPAFQAIHEMSSPTSLADKDIIIDISGLMVLWDIARGYSSPLRLDIELVGNAIIVSKRNERLYIIRNNQHQNKQFEYSFQRAFTKPLAIFGELQDYTETQMRIVTYKFGVHSVVVRGSVDVAIPDDSRKMDVYQSTDPDLQYHGALRIIHRGSTISQSAVAAIRTVPKNDNSHFYHQTKLWFGRVTTEFRGEQNGFVVNTAEFKNLIKTMKKLAIENQGTMISLVGTGGPSHVLQFHLLEKDAARLIPPPLAEVFWPRTTSTQQDDIPALFEQIRAQGMPGAQPYEFDITVNAPKLVPDALAGYIWQKDQDIIEDKIPVIFEAMQAQSIPEVTL